VSADYDVVVVGSRIAGATLATQLAESGLRVVAVDRASFPSDTVSTHVVYPNTLARFDRLGVLDEILAHGPPPLYTVWHHGGRMFTAAHTPEAGRDWALCVRRITLDAILVDRARAAGAEVLEGFTVRGLVGTGTADDPISGVVGQHDGRERTLQAPLVVGADGSRSTVARLVGARRRLIVPTESMMLFGYWTGMPERNAQEFFFEPPWLGTHFPTDDGVHLVILFGPVEEFPAGSRDELYRRKIGSIALLGDRLAGASQVGRTIGTTQLDGFYRDAAGPGWVLLGDAGHFKHPAAVQGIADAVQGAEVLAQMIVAGTQQREFEPWRDAETREMFAFSRFVAANPTDEAIAGILDAAIADADTARSFVDIWSRAQPPWAVVPRIPVLLEALGDDPEDVLAALEPTEAGAST
jgi:flavin-dependent dehydrogenase